MEQLESDACRVLEVYTELNAEHLLDCEWHVGPNLNLANGCADGGTPTQTVGAPAEAHSYILKSYGVVHADDYRPKCLPGMSQAQCNQIVPSNPQRPGIFNGRW